MSVFLFSLHLSRFFLEPAVSLCRLGRYRVSPPPPLCEPLMCSDPCLQKTRIETAEPCCEISNIMHTNTQHVFILCAASSLRRTRRAGLSDPAHRGPGRCHFNNMKLQPKWDVGGVGGGLAVSLRELCEYISSYGLAPIMTSPQEQEVTPLIGVFTAKLNRLLQKRLEGESSRSKISEPSSWQKVAGTWCHPATVSINP